MKRLRALFPILVLLLLCACGQAEPTQQIMTATITQIGEGYYLVEPTPDSPAHSSVSIIQVPMENLEPSPEPQIGDTIQVTYDGSLQETDPARITTVYSIRVTAQAEVPEPTANDPWGLTLTVQDLSPTGMTLIINQAGGSPTGELQFGSDFTLEVQDGGAWNPVTTIIEGEIGWTAEAYLVAMNGATEHPIDWTYLYGELPTGNYRISKQFMDFRGPGDYDRQNYTAEFELP